MCPTAGTRLRRKPLLWHNLSPAESLKIMTLISEPRSGSTARLARANQQEQHGLGGSYALASWQWPGPPGSLRLVLVLSPYIHRCPGTEGRLSSTSKIASKTTALLTRESMLVSHPAVRALTASNRMRSEVIKEFDSSSWLPSTENSANGSTALNQPSSFNEYKYWSSRSQLPADNLQFIFVG